MIYLLNTIASGGVGNGSIGFAFVDATYVDSNGTQLPQTIATEIGESRVKGGLDKIIVPTSTITDNGIVELGLKVTESFNHLAFANPKYVTEYDFSGFALNTINTVKRKEFDKNKNLTQLRLPNTITSIENYAFAACDKLKELRIPPYVKQMDDYALYGLTMAIDQIINESNIDLEANDYFHGDIYDVIQEDGLCIRGTTAVKCKKDATHVVIPEGITIIEEKAFQNCGNLQTVVLPSTIEKIGDYAFRLCPKLNQINLPSSIVEIGVNILDYNVMDVEKIVNESKFDSIENKYFGSVVFVNGACVHNNTLIGVYGENVVIPNHVTSMKDNCAMNNSVVKTITFGNGISQISQNAFNNCENLTMVKFNDAISVVRTNAFANCPQLKEIHVSSLSNWLNINFFNTHANPMCGGGDLYVNEEMVTDFIIPNDIEYINNYAFVNCKNINNLTVGNHVKSIERYAFDGCVICKDNMMLAQDYDMYYWNYFGAKIYNTVNEDGLVILDNAVIKCDRNVTAVTIPNGVTTIATDAFNNYSRLSYSIYIIL